MNHIRYSQKKDREDYNKKRGFEAVDVEGPTDDIVPCALLTAKRLLVIILKAVLFSLTFVREGVIRGMRRDGIRRYPMVWEGVCLGEVGGRRCVCSIFCLHCLQVQPKKKRCNLLDSDAVFVPPNYNRDQ